MFNLIFFSFSASELQATLIKVCYESRNDIIKNWLPNDFDNILRNIRIIEKDVKSMKSILLKDPSLINFWKLCIVDKDLEEDKCSKFYDEAIKKGYNISMILELVKGIDVDYIKSSDVFLTADLYKKYNDKNLHILKCWYEFRNDTYEIAVKYFDYFIRLDSRISFCNCVQVWGIRSVFLYLETET